MGKGGKDIGMRLALGQAGGEQRRRRGERRQPVRIVEEAGGVGPQQFAGDRAEMLGQAAAPRRSDQVARLQHRPPPRRLPAADQTEMAAVLAGQELDDQPALAVPASGHDKARVSPLHQAS